MSLKPLSEEFSDMSYSLSSKVFVRLQNDILNGQYKPGDKLIETTLSKELGVSRTPIREAIKQLELEGLVKFIPNKGAIVTGVSISDVEDIYQIRELIEGLAARWAAKNITDEELDVLSEVVALEALYENKQDHVHLLKYDSRFHEIIFKACKSNPLMFMLKTFHLYVQSARNTSLAAPSRAKCAHLEHKAILDALINRDADLAEKLMTEHISKASAHIVQKRD